MGQTAEELKQQLEQNRDDLGRDLVAIGDKVSPGRVMDRKRAAVGERMTRVRDSVMGTADAMSSTVGDTVTGVPSSITGRTQGSPFAAGVMAFGAGLLAGTLLPASRKEQEVVQDHIQPALESAVGSVASQAGAAVQELKDRGPDAVGEVLESAKHAAQDAAPDHNEKASGLGGASTALMGDDPAR